MKIRFAISKILILAAVYFFTAKFGLKMDAASGFASLVWPPTGISFAALFIFGNELWPGIFLGAFLINRFSGAPFPSAFGIGVGNTLEALLGTYILRKSFGFRPNFERVTDAVSFLFVTLIMTLVSPTLGVLSLWTNDIVRTSAIYVTWITWWIGDALGNFVVGAFLLSWLTPIRFRKKRLLEVFLLGLSLVGIIWLVFWTRLGPHSKIFPVTAYAVFPSLLWAALRFESRGATGATLFISILAIAGTAFGFGPFAQETLRDSLFSLQLFIGVVATTALIMSAVVKEMRESERSARQQEERFRAIFNQVVVGMAQTDMQGRFINANPRFCEIMGRSKDELLRLQVQDITHPEDISKTIERLQILAKEKTALAFEKRYLKPDGSSVWGYISISKILTEPECLVAAVVDITGQKNLEKELRTIQGNLEVRIQERTSELSLANEELRRSNKELESFAYVASHDLQEPLRMISNYTQLLEKRYKDKLDVQASEFIHFIVSSAYRMKSLIDDLLSYSRIRSEPLNLQFYPIEKLIEEAISNLKFLIQEKKPQIDLESLPSLRVNHSQIVQLFQNLIENAIKFHSAEPARIHISAKQESSEWIFKVQDNGIGIDREYYERIFSIFQRLKPNEYPGTGIGLAICKRIVERHGGHIWVESESGKGSTFCFTLSSSGERHV